MYDSAFNPLLWWLCEGGFCLKTVFFYPLSSPWEREALCQRIICQQSCPTANSFSFKQNKRLHYSGCHLTRMDRLSLCQAARLHTYQQICLLFASEDISFQQSPFPALLYCTDPEVYVPESTPEDHTQGLQPSSVGCFLLTYETVMSLIDIQVLLWSVDALYHQHKQTASEGDLSMSTLHTSQDKCVYTVHSH